MKCVLMWDEVIHFYTHAWTPTRPHACTHAHTHTHTHTRSCAHVIKIPTYYGATLVQLCAWGKSLTGVNQWPMEYTYVGSSYPCIEVAWGKRLTNVTHTNPAPLHPVRVGLIYWGNGDFCSYHPSSVTSFVILRKFTHFYGDALGF